jgi:hypothetical protein
VGIVGVVVGVVLGAYLDRWQRYRGDVHCQLGDLIKKSSGQGGLPLLFDLSIEVYFFNQKEVDLGLSELTVLLVYESGEVVLGPETRNYTTLARVGRSISPLRLMKPSA